MANNSNYLFLVVVGGRVSKSNIEQHDIRWVVGSKIEDTFDSLRKNWFGYSEGFHIDSYKKIYSVDGYKVNLKKVKNRKININQSKKKDKNGKNLWFVNLGGYSPQSMQEKHEFGLVVAESSSEAKKIAKSKWLVSYEKKHNDDIAHLKTFFDIDNCEKIKDVENWQIELILENNIVEESNIPDWYGYWRIDKKYEKCIAIKKL